MASGQLEQRQRTSQQSQRAPRFLLVDDDPLVLEAMHRVLSDARPNWELVDAHSTRAALIELYGKQFDVVVTDLELAGASGLELLETLDRHCPHISRVVHSARLDAYLTHPALNAATGMLSKPAQPRELVSMLNDALWASVVARRTQAHSTDQTRAAAGAGG
jgi:DNA-binding NarL/FixJ family response regulator